jgi:hypothetical protein
MRVLTIMPLAPRVISRGSAACKLAALPGVQRLTSTIVMKRVVADRPYPT